MGFSVYLDRQGEDCTPVLARFYFIFSAQIWARLGKLAACWTAVVETSKDGLRLFIGGSSVRAKQSTYFLIARLGSWHFESSSHNPEGRKGAPPAADKATAAAGQALAFAQTTCRANA